MAYIICDDVSECSEMKIYFHFTRLSLRLAMYLTKMQLCCIMYSGIDGYP